MFNFICANPLWFSWHIQLGLVSASPLTAPFQLEQVAFCCRAAQELIIRYLLGLQDFLLLPALHLSPEGDKGSSGYSSPSLAKQNN